VRFLADESCDFAVVTTLRAAGHDVTAVVEISPRAKDPVVGGHQTAGVLLIRFPGDARSSLGEAVSRVVAELGERIKGAFVVIEPGRARVSRPPPFG